MQSSANTSIHCGEERTAPLSGGQHLLAVFQRMIALTAVLALVVKQPCYQFIRSMTIKQVLLMLYFRKTFSSFVSPRYKAVKSKQPTMIASWQLSPVSVTSIRNLFWPWYQWFIILCLEKGQLNGGFQMKTVTINEGNHLVRKQVVVFSRSDRWRPTWSYFLVLVNQPK